jgi:hypothetical protein
MRGARKVRVFQNLKKSPNWYVEWRDVSGKRRCQSCGPNEREAQERARKIGAELRRLRDVECLNGVQADGGEHPRNLVHPSRATPTTLRLNAFLKCHECAIPVQFNIQVNSDLVTCLNQLLSSARLANSGE